jgi:hypothetical protein
MNPPLAHRRAGLGRAGRLLLLLCGVLPLLLALAAPPAAAQDDPAPEPIPPDQQDDPAPWDIGGQVRHGITDFFHNLVESALNPVLETMGQTVLATPDLTSNEQVRTVWTANLVIANTVFVLFIVAAGLVIVSRETLQTSYGLKELVPRIVVAGLASNLSLLLVGQMIEFANALTAGIAGQGVDPGTAAQALADIWANAAVGTNFLASLLMIAIVVMAIIVVITFIMRVAVLCVLLMVAPLALLFHALPQTEQLAFTWWKAVAGCFAIQLGQTVVLVAAVAVFLTPTGPSVLGFPASGSGWLGLLVALAMMWLLVKIPMWVKDYLWLHSRGILRKVIFALIMLKTVSMAAAGRAGRSGRGRPHPGSEGPGPGRSGSPSGPGPGPRRGPGTRPSPRGGPASGPRVGARHRVDPRQPRPAGGRRSAAQPASSPPPGPSPGRSPSAPPGPPAGPPPAPAGRQPQPAPAVEPTPSRRAGDAVPAAPVPPVRAGGAAAGRAGATDRRAGGAPAADAGRPPLRPGSGESPAHPTADRNAARRTTRPVLASPGQPVHYSHTAYTPRPAVSRPEPVAWSTPPAAAPRQQPHPAVPRAPRRRPTPTIGTPSQPGRGQPAAPHSTPPSPPSRGGSGQVIHDEPPR